MILLLVGSVASSAALPAYAQLVPAPIPAATASSLRDLVAQLGSAEFQTRLDAEQQLRIHPDAVLTKLEELLLDPKLDAEQRSRLASLARERFSSEPRAALGINFSLNVGNRASAPAVIAGTLEGFDSTRVLQANDAILAFDGSRISDRAGFRSHILSYDPGDMVRLSIERNGEILEVHVQMGSQRDLPNDGATQDITELVLDDAWLVRSHRKHLNLDAGEAVLDGHLSPANWRATWTSADGAVDPREPVERIGIAAGGEPRGATADSMREFVGGEFRAMQFGRGQRSFQLEQIRQFEQTLEEFDRLINQLRAQLPNVAADKQPAELQKLARLMQERDNIARTITLLRASGRDGPGRNGIPRQR